MTTKTRYQGFDLGRPWGVRRRWTSGPITSRCLRTKKRRHTTAHPLITGEGRRPPRRACGRRQEETAARCQDPDLVRRLFPRSTPLLLRVRAFERQYRHDVQIRTPRPVDQLDNSDHWPEKGFRRGHDQGIAACVQAQAVLPERETGRFIAGQERTARDLRAPYQAETGAAPASTQQIQIPEATTTTRIYTVGRRGELPTSRPASSRSTRSPPKIAPCEPASNRSRTGPPIGTRVPPSP
jgi:hypothetical protein